MDTGGLEWERGGTWFVWTKCRRYSVAKAMVDGVASYLPYLRHDTGQRFAPPSEIIGDNCATAAEAMKVCEEHAANHQKAR